MEFLGRRFRRPVWLGSLRRTTPISSHWGFDRGTPIDRYYIESFLEEHRADVRGACLEIRDARYSELFGSDVTSADVLDVDPSNPHATIVADLADAADVPSNRFDCFILTQTLQFIREPAAAIGEAHRVLRPGGVLLATVPAVSRIDRAAGVEGDFWRFTRAGLRVVLERAFEPARVEVRCYGNVLAAVGFLMGLATEDLTRRELDVQDDFFPLLVAARVVKS